MKRSKQCTLSKRNTLYISETTRFQTYLKWTL